ncbi:MULTISPECIES: DUF6883 domain-containing protein [unclassified Thermoanaerobacter]|uniref:DUF6883 domain-containing protein n=1 Tax=unclassified Thermoanaerobacter TaxID=2636821 RepID=UPI0000E1DE7E|nr:DUF6883 domain-containing protein [Thermoanaerobacter sp. X514]ABY93121.1 hypothetical protein Teth514_1840 [Thermoanaerobacter sp. X514]HAA63817.1 hypothetical protein [Thermoanaerobacter sp.]
MRKLWSIIQVIIDLVKNFMDNLKNFPAILQEEDKYEKRYEITIELTRPNGNIAKVKTGWIEKKETDKFRLMTIFVNK